MVQAHWNLSILGADPTDNLQIDDVYLNDGTLTPNSKPGFRRRKGDNTFENVGGFATAVSADDVTTPTDAELDSAFGTPATLGNGFIGLLDDNGADANVFLCMTNGTSWWFTALTKAT